jgi:hypothetical protein
MWPVCGPRPGSGSSGRLGHVPLTWEAVVRAGDRDRTGMTSLEGCGSQRFELLQPRSGHLG